MYVKKHNLAEGGAVLSNVRHGGIAMVPQGNGTAKVIVCHHHSLILPKQRLIEQEPGFRQTFHVLIRWKISDMRTMLKYMVDQLLLMCFSPGI